MPVCQRGRGGGGGGGEVTTLSLETYAAAHGIRQATESSQYGCFGNGGLFSYLETNYVNMHSFHRPRLHALLTL